MAYCVAADVKAWLGVTDTALDGIVAVAIDAAAEWVDGYCNRSFVPAGSASTRYFDSTDGRNLLVDDFSDTTVTLATDDAQDGTYETTWDVGDFQVVPPVQLGRPYSALISGAKTFPLVRTRDQLVAVTAKWGWAATPTSVKQANIMQAARIVNRRNSPNGVAGMNDFGLVRVSNADNDISALLDPYVLPAIA